MPHLVRALVAVLVGALAGLGLSVGGGRTGRTRAAAAPGEVPAAVEARSPAAPQSLAGRAMVGGGVAAAAGGATPGSGAGSDAAGGAAGIPHPARAAGGGAAPSGTAGSGAAVAARPAGTAAPAGDVPIPVLMYHVIGVPGPRAPWPALYVAPPLFGAQMAALHAAGYQAVTLRQAFAIWDASAAAPAHPVVLSFDDGYTGDATEAGPVLAGYGWPGVLCQQVQRIGYPGGLTAGQIEGLLRAGWELADHGVSQPEVDLTTATPAVAAWEVGSSRTDLERTFGVAVTDFCYPVGHYDPAVIDLVRSAGFTGALTTVSGAADPGTEGELRLDRLRVDAGEAPAALLAALRDAVRRAPPAPPPSVPPPFSASAATPPSRREAAAAGSATPPAAPPSPPVRGRSGARPGAGSGP